MTACRPRLLTIVLNYKTAGMTLRSAEAARAAMEGIPGEITIVDNDSQDGSFETLTDEVAARGWGAGPVPMRVLQSGHNGGFGAGNNVGIRAGLSDGTAPDLYYILNSDAFPEPDAIRLLMAHLDAEPGAGFAGSFIRGEDGATHLTTFRFPSLASEFEDAIRFGPVSRLLKDAKVPIDTPDKAQPVDWLAGASLIMRREVLDRIGLFDETFFLYFEETDLCRRAAKAGWRTDFVPASVVTHIGSVSTGMKTWDRVPDYWFDSRLYYFIKNHGRLHAAAATLLQLLGGSFHKIRCALTGRDRGRAPHFLRTLVRHDFRGLFRSFPSRDRQTDGETRPQPGE